MPRERVKNTMRTAEEKEKILLEYLTGKVGYRVVAESHDINASVFLKWINKYRENGIEGLKSQTGKSKGGNKGRKKWKNISKEEKLERENIKLKIEIERLKKSYYVRGVGRRKEYISINNRSAKSSES